MGGFWHPLIDDSEVKKTESAGCCSNLYVVPYFVIVLVSCNFFFLFFFFLVFQFLFIKLCLGFEAEEVNVVSLSDEVLGTEYE